VVDEELGNGRSRGRGREKGKTVVVKYGLRSFGGAQFLEPVDLDIAIGGISAKGRHDGRSFPLLNSHYQRTVEVGEW
jgi:hypothetical protein